MGASDLKAERKQIGRNARSRDPKLQVIGRTPTGWTRVSCHSSRLMFRERPFRRRTVLRGTANRLADSRRMIPAVQQCGRLQTSSAHEARPHRQEGGISRAREPKSLQFAATAALTPLLCRQGQDGIRDLEDTR